MNVEYKHGERYRYKMKRNIALVLNSQLSNREKLELLITHMCPNASGNSRFISVFLQYFDQYATDQQHSTFVNAYVFGWNISKIVWNAEKKKIAVGLYIADRAAWVPPSGMLERAEIGEKRAYLGDGWEDL